MAAIDTGSIPTAVLALTAANNMVAGNNGQMLVFQPTLTTTVAEEPKIPKGSYVMYTGAIMAGTLSIILCVCVAFDVPPPSLCAQPVIASKCVHVLQVALVCWQSYYACVIQAFFMLTFMLLPHSCSCLYNIPVTGEVLTDNVLLVKGKTDKQSLAGAIAARMRSNAHTVLECYGSSAVSVTIEVCAVENQVGVGSCFGGCKGFSVGWPLVSYSRAMLCAVCFTNTPCASTTTHSLL